MIGVPVSISLSVAALTAVVFGGLPASLHGYRSKDLWRAAVQLYHGHCIFCAGWQSYDEGGISRRIVDFADCLVGNVREAV